MKETERDDDDYVVIYPDEDGIEDDLDSVSEIITEIKGLINIPPQYELVSNDLYKDYNNVKKHL